MCPPHLSWPRTSSEATTKCQLSRHGPNFPEKDGWRRSAPMQKRRGLESSASRTFRIWVKPGRVCIINEKSPSRRRALCLFRNSVWLPFASSPPACTGYRQAEQAPDGKRRGLWYNLTLAGINISINSDKPTPVHIHRISTDEENS